MTRSQSVLHDTIIAAAIPIFAERGLAGATIRRLAAAAGVNSGLLYYYFENKQALFQEALTFVFRGLLDRLAPPPQEFADGQARIEFLVTGLLDYYRAHPPRFKLTEVAFVLHPELAARSLQQIVNEGQVGPLQILWEGVERGQLRPVPPVQVWACVVGMCFHSLQVNDLVNGLDYGALGRPELGQERAAVSRHITDLLGHGLLVPPPAPQGDGGSATPAVPAPGEGAP